MFEWNDEKARLNLDKHGVSFEEVRTVFDDPLYIGFPDPVHSYNEFRFIVIGQSAMDRLLMVAYTERRDQIRIISAREATPKERRKYVKENS